MPRVLTFFNKFIKTALAIEVERWATGDDPVRILDWLTDMPGYPVFIRMDNRPETKCTAITDSCGFNTNESVIFEPHARWRKAFVASINGKVSDKLIAFKVLDTLLKGKDMDKDQLAQCNTYRPHASIDKQTSSEGTLDWSNYARMSKTTARST